MKEVLRLDDCVSSLRGVGAAKAKQLEKLGILSVRDLLYYFPRAYERRGDIRKLSEAEENLSNSFLLTVGTKVTTAKIRSGFSISKFRAFDESGSVEIMFFNSPFVKDVFHLGTVFRFYGKLYFHKGRPTLSNPKYEAYIEGIPLKNYVPVYSLTEGLTSNAVTKLVEQCMTDALSALSDPLPEHIRLSLKLPTLSYAIRAAHFPQTDAMLSAALRRLAFDEMLLFALQIAYAKKERDTRIGVTIPPCKVSELTALLPYELTASQKRSVNEIYRDMTTINKEGYTPTMARILVGDVGSGKTVCAALAAYIAIKGGFQVAFMVPTEILARQHYTELSSLFSKLGIRTSLLLGASTQSEKNRVYSEAEKGETDIIIGTHALLSDKVIFKNLGLVITDEQHRFGVVQRATLKEKNSAAHLLVMSATPIPRTLALALYGDLDVSRLTELPAGRKPIDTFVVDESYESRLIAFIEKQVNEGGQCYVVCPAIEQDEEEEYFSPERLNVSPTVTSVSKMKSAIEYAERLSTLLPSLRIGCLHGKMKAAQKDEIMRDFSAGKIHVLVSTTVIEVGVNVPNSNLMIVQNAERFGLSQLHQLRGRIGRGSRKSYCVLVTGDNAESAHARLSVMKRTTDGYEIAEQDLLQRGPGDFFSQNLSDNFRQSGGISFRFAKLCEDTSLFDSAFSTAKSIIQSDPSLDHPDHQALKKILITAKISDVASLS
ncbi:MAG: ATP-dependent DNA helicase RecG [Clostridia bacterium]|nr:ATP-dependent DNA helicase RecG [Clostridia bacterium]